MIQVMRLPGNGFEFTLASIPPCDSHIHMTWHAAWSHYLVVGSLSYSAPCMRNCNVSGIWPYLGCSVVLISMFVCIQATYAQESTQRVLLIDFIQKATTPIVAAYGMVASYPYPCNSPAIMAAFVKRVEKLAITSPSSQRWGICCMSLQHRMQHCYATQIKHHASVCDTEKYVNSHNAKPFALL